MEPSIASFLIIVIVFVSLGIAGHLWSEHDRKEEKHREIIRRNIVVPLANWCKHSAYNPEGPDWFKAKRIFRVYAKYLKITDPAMDPHDEVGV